MLGRRRQSRHSFQAPLPGGAGLPGNAAHQINIQVFKSRLGSRLIGAPKILPAMNPSKGQKLLVLCGLQADAEPVHPSPFICPKLIPRKCARVHLHGNLTFLPNPILPVKGIQDPLNPGSRKNGRRSSSQINGLHLIVGITPAFCFDFPAQCLEVPLLLLLSGRCGQEITIETFSDAKGDVNINAQFLFRLFFHNRLCP